MKRTHVQLENEITVDQRNLKMRDRYLGCADDIVSKPELHSNENGSDKLWKIRVIDGEEKSCT